MNEGGSSKLDGCTSPTTSSPPTPPSPLPVSIGPGNQKYIFLASPSPSPPFSPPPSSHTSAENLPLILPEKESQPVVPSPFSLDGRVTDHNSLDSKTSCVHDLLVWFIETCCNACFKDKKANTRALQYREDF